MPVAKPRYLLCEKLLPGGVFLFAETCFTRLDFVGSELLLNELEELVRTGVPVRKYRSQWEACGTLRQPEPKYPICELREP